MGIVSCCDCISTEFFCPFQQSAELHQWITEDAGIRGPAEAVLLAEIEDYLFCENIPEIDDVMLDIKRACYFTCGVSCLFRRSMSIVSPMT